MIWRMETGTLEVSSTMSIVAHKSSIYLSAARTQQPWATPRNYHELQTFLISNKSNYCIKRCCGTRAVHAAHTAWLTGCQAAVSPVRNALHSTGHSAPWTTEAPERLRRRLYRSDRATGTSGSASQGGGFLPLGTQQKCPQKGTSGDLLDASWLSSAVFTK